ncbi:MAG: ABC transporter ATP-binding protein [Oscillospiraceae bacterium]|jgi:ABC-type lipoprotein export system ATPase subunit|nr:ABC transporter ATP-binding protein [Oscillospiraceae bacterium]
MDERQSIIECENLVKIYKTKELEVLALQGLDLTIERGELMAIIGNSGSGKSTFLNMIGGLDRPSAGKLRVAGQDLFKLSEKELVGYKRTTVGFVWQNNARNLLPYLTAWQNVQTPMLFDSTAVPYDENAKLQLSMNKKTRALQLLELVGMGHRKNNKLSQLSGGELQRVAIALALANNPKILLADEPTGSVDLKTANYILDVLRELNKELGTTIIIVTHDRGLSKKVHRVVAIRDGKTSSEFITRQSRLSDLSSISGLGENGEYLQDEFVVLDRAGRIQIPRDLLDKMELEGNRVKLEYQDGKVVISSPGAH